MDTDTHGCGVPASSRWTGRRLEQNCMVMFWRNARRELRAFFTPSYTYLSPVDERNASSDAPGAERRCLGNISQSCVQDCATASSGGNLVRMRQKSTGQCCTPGNGNNCQ